VHENQGRVMGPTGVPLMGELRKNQFTRRLKSCPSFIRAFREKVNRNL
jgi:hypothetical protein